MAGNSIAYNRHTRILDILNQKGTVRVDELSEALDISLVTVRRDLDLLNQKGYLLRTHGGAALLTPPSEALQERRFAEKDVVNIVEKKRIAEKAGELVNDDEILFMNSGSTVLFFMRALRKRIRLITNNAAALTGERNPQIELMMLGGAYREQSRSLVGELALNAIHDIYSSRTFLGTNGLSIERGLTTSVFQECGINQAMIENTQGEVIVLADYSKMDKVSNFVSAPLSSVDVVVTDSRCPVEFRKRLEDAGIRVIVA
jgi:DeoR family fructose operon transcriptional repressor